MSLRHHEIAEADHRILNPLLEDHLRLIGDAAGITDGTRVLDLASGKGEMLCRWAEWYGATGTGVDLSEIFVTAARERARELRVEGRVAFVLGEAAEFARSVAVEAGASYDVAACIGATWIGGGLAGTVELMRPAVRRSGTLLVGEVFLEEPAPPEALEAFGFGPDDYASLVGTVDRLEAAGLDVVEMVAADQRSWERYEAAQWLTVTRWLEANPDDPEHEAVRAFRDVNRRTYLEWGRRYLGWAVFVTKPR